MTAALTIHINGRPVYDYSAPGAAQVQRERRYISHLARNITYRTRGSGWGAGLLIDPLIRGLHTLDPKELKSPEAVFRILDEIYNTSRSGEGLYLHGSSSASLISVADRGLQPLGWLLQKGIVPFTGEIERGAAGISRNNISVMNASSGKRVSDRYADISTVPWTMDDSRELIDMYERYLADFRARMTGKFGRTAKEVLDYYRSDKYEQDKKEIPGLQDEVMGDMALLDHIKIYENKIATEKLRQKYWESLSEAERLAIEEPFPVQYLIEYDGIPDVPVSDIHGEFIISATIEPADLVAFVPKDKVDLARQLTKGKIRVMAVEEMDAYISSLASTHNRFMKVIKEVIESLKEEC